MGATGILLEVGETRSGKGLPRSATLMRIPVRAAKSERIVVTGAARLAGEV